MPTTVAELAAHLEAIAPPALQAPYDNSGLLVGEPATEITGVLCSLDCTEEVVAEAAARGCNVVVAHHPIVFGGLKRLTGRTYVERVVMSALRQNVALYACHTNLDSVLARGVNGRIAERLGLRDVRVLAPAERALRKLAVYVPTERADAVAEALWGAGAGRVGRYDRASFRSPGTGTFRPLAGARPAIGEAPVGAAAGADERVGEVKLEVVVPRVLADAALDAARRAHPYEAMAYDLYDVDGAHPDFGAGAVGELERDLSAEEWLATLSERMGLRYVKHTDAPDRPIRRVAVCGGAGGFLLGAARGAGADAFVTSDYKYHDFFDAEGALMICDVGHYESERFTIDVLYESIAEQFGTFAARKTRRDTNPVRLYLPPAAVH